jgi:sugar (pentulose or hexulose) kinase
MKKDASQHTRPLVIGLDSSTTAMKALALDSNGQVLAAASQPIPLSSPQPNHYEQDPNHWWRAARLALREITRQIDPARIKALAISNQRETFVPLGWDQQPLRPAIIWLDERCKEEVEPFASEFGKKKLLKITGKPVDYAPVLYRLAWMKYHESERYRNIAMICDVHSYLVWKLTDVFRTSWASACPLGIFDLSRKEWSQPILDALALVPEQLPAAFCPGTVLGQVTDEAAAATGLIAGTAIAAGGGDGQAAGLGVAALQSDRAYLNLGTAVVAGVYNRKYKTGSAFRTICSCSDAGYYYESSLRAGTFAVDWLLKSVMGLDPARDPSIHQQLTADAGHLPPGSEGLFFVPYLNGVMNPYWDMNARGAFVGLSSAHERPHLYRAVLEGIAFEKTLALEAIEKTLRAPVRELIAIGGGTANALWLTILADITGRPIQLPSTSEASALGAGIAAAVAAGLHSDFRTAADAMTAIRETITPNPTRHKTYQSLLETYTTLYPNLSR